MSMAIKYGLQKKARMAEGGMVKCDAHGTADCGVCGEEGGEVAEKAPAGEHEDGDVVGRIMKKRMMAKGGEVEPMADFESADYDAMDEMKVPDEADYTGANSGDELGNEEMDENDRDLIARIMRSRAKKDHNPRPA